MNKKISKKFMVDIGVAPDFQIQNAIMMKMMMMIISRLNESVAAECTLFVVKK